MIESHVTGAPVFAPSDEGRTASFAARSRLDSAHRVLGAEFSRAAADLLRLASQEELHRAQAYAGAWVHRLFDSGSESVRAWQRFNASLNAQLQASPPNLQTLRTLADSSPASDDGIFRQLNSILGEQNSDFMAVQLLSLARDCLRRGNHPQLTEALLTLAVAHPATHAQALDLVRVASGGGSFGQQVEFQGPHLLSELGSPLMLTSFGLASLFSRSASLAVLARSSRLTLGTLIASESAALLTEVPTLVISRRLGQQLWLGGENLLSPSGIGHDMAASFLPFALLRGTSNFFQMTSPALRQVSVFRTAEGGFNLRGRAFTQGAQFGSEVFAMMLGNSLNAYWGIAPHSLNTSENFVHSLLTVANMRLASRLVESSGLFEVPAALAGQREMLFNSRLRRFLDFTRWEDGHPLRDRALRELHSSFTEGRFQTFTLEKWIDWAGQGRWADLSVASDGSKMPLLATRWASLGPRDSGARSDFDLDDASGFALATPGAYIPFRPKIDATKESLMATTGSGGRRGDGKDPPSAPGDKQEVPSQSRIVLELLRSSLDDYEKAQDAQSTFLLSAARGLKSLIDKMSDRPDLSTDLAFAERLSEIEEELKRVGESESKVRKIVDTLKVLIRRSPPEVVAPEAAQTQQNQIDEQQEERESIARNLRSLHGILQAARDGGWTEGLKSKLGGTLTRLNELFRNTLWKIPGLESWRAARANEASQKDRRQALVLGMAQGGLGTERDSPMAKELRGEAGSAMPHDDLELELLHRSILTTVQSKAGDKTISRDISALVNEYHVATESAAAMHLMGLALHRLVTRETQPEDLLEYLKSQPAANSLTDHFLLLTSLATTEGLPGEGLDLLAVEPNAADYFASGLHTFLRAKDSPETIQLWSQIAKEENVRGYHPSIAQAFFGAAYGLEKMPREIDATRVDTILEKALKGE